MKRSAIIALMTLVSVIALAIVADHLPIPDGAASVVHSIQQANAIHSELATSTEQTTPINTTIISAPLVEPTIVVTLVVTPVVVPAISTLLMQLTMPNQP